MKKLFHPEYKKLWDEVLFWAKRLSYKAADYHPEWRTKYEEAVRKRDEWKATHESTAYPES